MIRLRFDENCEPKYMTRASAGCDVVAREAVLVPAGGVARVPTGVWIESVDWDNCPKGQIPELQLRARSGLAFKFGITLANGVGTIDADFPDEIGVLLLNTAKTDFEVKQGMRIGQLVLNTVYQIPSLPVGGERTGGFGSTKLN